ncbi:isochorismate synthase [Actinomadura sp. ATCC 31491]|uniref:isochorismate synthase n=1 Tax=Actinomadura luzonensis TaxID=2805427 RepID=A0ABT0G1L5_9ACTN|nr:isochorismate synthase [Actinomadura luzonensis]MCK2218486.1 isochorismate synthase [Actinomadura luzonensis]
MSIGDFLFASPRGTLRARGVRRAVPPACDGGTLAERAANALRACPGDQQSDGPSDRTGIGPGGGDGGGDGDGQGAAIVAGAVPFAADADPCLFVPREIRRTTTPPPAPRPGRAIVPPDARYVPTADAYAEMVRRAVARVRAGDLDKVVLARSLAVPYAGRTEPLVAAMSAGNPDGYTFAVGLPGGRLLFGVSPELLVSRRGRAVAARPMAGSAPRDSDPRELLASAKDRHEHALVVQAVAAALAPYCDELSVPECPTPVAAGPLWHLATAVSGRLADPATTSLTLATSLHPTPAVCGTPTGEALRLVGELEPFDRGFYTGLVGWQDPAGDGEWVICLRCALADGRALTFYAGAGIVAGSDPAAELAETDVKLSTALGVLVRH